MTRLKRSREPTEPEPLSNQTDRAHVARHQADKLRANAKAEAMDLAPSLIGVMGGLAEEIRALRLTDERAHALTEELCLVIRDMTAATRESIAMTREMAHELAALRMQRAAGGNGHAADDNLTSEQERTP